MQGPVNYFLEHRTGNVSLTLNDTQLLVETEGNGSWDKPKSLDIALCDLKYFYIVPVLGIQRLQNVRSQGDLSYDSELVFSYYFGEKAAIKRVFVNRSDPAFVYLVDILKKKRPDACLLHLTPEAALRQMGAASASKTLRFLLALLIGIPVLLLLVYIFTKTTHH